MEEEEGLVMGGRCRQHGGGGGGGGSLLPGIKAGVVVEEGISWILTIRSESS